MATDGGHAQSPKVKLPSACGQCGGAFPAEFAGESNVAPLKARGMCQEFIGTPSPMAPGGRAIGSATGAKLVSVIFSKQQRPRSPMPLLPATVHQGQISGKARRPLSHRRQDRSTIKDTDPTQIEGRRGVHRSVDIQSLQAYRSCRSARYLPHHPSRRLHFRPPLRSPSQQWLLERSPRRSLSQQLSV